MENAPVLEKDLARELHNRVQDWVSRTFNYVQLEVYVKMAEDCLFDYIESPDIESVVWEWLCDTDYEDIIEEFFGDDLDTKEFNQFKEASGTVEDSFRTTWGEEKLQEVKDWIMEEKESELDDYRCEQENYPMWNTLFEFRDSSYGSQVDIDAIMGLGMGVINGLEPFNTTIFMMSCGHSFYSSYWIPLWLKLHNKEDEYEGVDYSMF